MKKYKITHSSGISAIWEEKDIQEVNRILRAGYRTVLTVRGNSPIYLTIDNSSGEEIK